MPFHKTAVPLICAALLTCSAIANGPVHTTEEFITAVREGNEGTTIVIGEGTFELTETLELKSGMTLKGAGSGKTIITNAAQWKASPKSLPDPEMRLEGLETDAYLIRLQRDTAGVTISGMTLLGPQVHGAIFTWFHDDLHLDDLRIENTMWCGVRSFGMRRAKIHDCQFVDSGGRWEQGTPGRNGGITGGGIFATWMADCEISNNRFISTQDKPERNFYGIKVRKGVRCRVHHNTIRTNFSIEFPFENDEDNELDHNICHGTISIPKFTGGAVPDSGKTFWIHHNLFKDSYSIEFVRNGVEIDHNLFDFDVKRDHGNLISAFGHDAARGPASFHNNLVNNPGRGVLWINEPYSNFTIRNNHIVARTTSTSRADGLFGFNPDCDFKTIVIKDNRIECVGIARSLLRSEESHSAVISNNTLVNISDAKELTNAKADRAIGLEEPLKFRCGVSGEIEVDGWNVTPVAK